MDQNGCGVIAAYNAFEILGKGPDFSDITLYFELFGLFLYGYLGVFPFVFEPLFKANGYETKSSLNPENFDYILDNYEVVIIEYWYGSGAHYVAVKKNCDGGLVVCNDNNDVLEAISYDSLQDFIGHDIVFMFMGIRNKGYNASKNDYSPNLISL